MSVRRALRCECLAGRDSGLGTGHHVSRFHTRTARLMAPISREVMPEPRAPVRAAAAPRRRLTGSAPTRRICRCPFRRSTRFMTLASTTMNSGGEALAPSFIAASRHQRIFCRRSASQTTAAGGQATTCESRTTGGRRTRAGGGSATVPDPRKSIACGPAAVGILCRKLFFTR